MASTQILRIMKTPKFKKEDYLATLLVLGWFLVVGAIAYIVT